MIQIGSLQKWTQSLTTRRVAIALVSVSVLAGIGWGLTTKYGSHLKTAILHPKDIITKAELAAMLAKSATFYQFPTEVPIPGQEGAAGVLQYSFDPQLQEEMEQLFASYRPDYGAFVAMDAETGRVISLISFSAKGMKENLALRASFPSASVFKVVTAAAAIEEKKYNADTVVRFNGANHTLYKHNILKMKENRWTRNITLKDAFAKSVNTVFGRIGALDVGPAELSEYALRFGFNRQIAADFPIQEGKAPIPNDTWELAETASGFTRDNTMSPIQGAMIAAAVVNHGVMMEPYFVQSVFTDHGEEVYTAQPKVASTSVDPSTAAEIRRLMQETVKRGTSSKSFHGFSRGKFKDLDVGGKTGSLTGTDPKGKYDWFVGYAEGRSKKIAFAALTIHEKFWRVKSSYLARRAIENYFK